jgi:HSP20 family protein
MKAIKSLKNKIKEFKNQPLDLASTFNDMRDEINSVFHKFLTNYHDSWPLNREGRDFFTPSLDLIENKNEYRVLVDMPGVEEKNIDVSLDNGLLKVTGKKEHLSEIKDATIHTIERNYGSFIKTLSLPDNIKQDKVHARLKNGVLELVIPKSEEVKKEIKKIKIT